MIPANAFWVICLTGDCGKLDLSKRDCYAQRYCAWFASHTLGKEYLQVEQLNKHSYKYWDGDLIEVEIENENENINNSDNNGSIMDNNNINQEPNSGVALQVATIVNKIIPKLKSSQRPSNIVGYLNNSNNSDMNNNNYNNNNNNNFDCDLNDNLSGSCIFNEFDNAALGMFVFDVFIFLFFSCSTNKLWCIAL